jgi:hypothetical protein
VVAVSCLEGLGQAALRYAAEVDARELTTIHVPGVLAAPLLRGWRGRAPVSSGT